MPRFYFDLRKAFEAHTIHDTPWTPAVSLVTALDSALQMIIDEGVENAWARHRLLAAACRAGITAMGLTLYSTSPSVSVTAVNLPDGLDWKNFNTRLRDDAGIVVAGGQGPVAGKIFRIAHLGYYDELDMVGVIAAIEHTLLGAGIPVTPGTGVRAVRETFAAAGRSGKT